MSVPMGPMAGVRSVAASLNPVQLANYNARRKMLSIFNASSGSLLLRFGMAPTATSYTIKMAPNSHYELPTVGDRVYQGEIWGMWLGGAGYANLTEEN